MTRWTPPSPRCRGDCRGGDVLTAFDTTERGIGGWILLNLVVLAAYSLLGTVIVLFGVGPAKISPIYPPAGIAVAATIILGPRILPAVFLGQFLNGFPLLMLPETSASMYVLANTGTGIGGIVEALLSRAVLLRATGAWHPFDRPRHVLIFLLGAALAPAVVAGCIGTFSLAIAGFVAPDERILTLVTFILADAAGIAVFGALVLAWYREPPVVGRSLDGAIAASALLFVSAAVLIAALAVWSRYPIDFLYLPLLMWAAFRAGPRGVTLAAAAITVVAILTTIDGVGSFVGKTPTESILLLEAFIAVITFTGLLTVAVRAQRLEAEAALEAHNRMLEQRVAERTAEVAEKNRLLEEKQARIDEDLQTAQLLQASILPTDFSGYTATAIAATMHPALEVSGDFYDVFAIAEGRLGLVVADVSGKGVAAAFFMAVTRTLLRGVAQGSGAERGPADCIAQVNEALCRENPIDMFVTTLYADLDERSGLVRFVNAGHCEPIVVRSDGSVELLKRAGNPPLGVMAGRAFREQSVTLALGEMLFLYSDGVSEATNRDGDLFHVPRLMEIARESAGRSAQELLGAVTGGVARFVAGTVQSDDITCLVVRRNALSSAS